MTKEQSIKADRLIEKLIETKNQANGSVAYELFDSSDEAIAVCKYLVKIGVVEIVLPTDQDPICIIRATDKASNFIKSGGITKMIIDQKTEKQKKYARESISDEILTLDLRQKRFDSKIGRKIIVASFIIVFLSFLISIITVHFTKTESGDKIQQKERDEIGINTP
nr:hypothetical protein [uncultured Marinifilum sp.]